MELVDTVPIVALIILLIAFYHVVVGNEEELRRLQHARNSINHALRKEEYDDGRYEEELYEVWRTFCGSDTRKFIRILEGLPKYGDENFVDQDGVLDREYITTVIIPSIRGYYSNKGLEIGI